MSGGNNMYSKSIQMLVVGMMLISAISVIIPLLATDNSTAYTTKGPGDTYITTTETWDLSGSPYYLEGDVYVNTTGSLTIDPGVEIYFNGLYSIYVWGNGNFKAVGTADDMILFTSNMTTPNQGDWGRIQFNDTTTFELGFCEISYANWALYIDGVDNGNIHNNNIHNNSFDGISITMNAKNTQIKENEIHHNHHSGVTIHDSHNNNITENIFYENNQGTNHYGGVTLTEDASYNEVYDNYFRDNKRNAVVVKSGSHHNNFTMNDMISNCGDEKAVEIDDAMRNNFTANRIIENTGSGIYLRWSDYNYFKDNYLYRNNDGDNDYSGIRLDDSNYNAFLYNTISWQQHKEWGIYVDPISGNNVFKYNDISTRYTVTDDNNTSTWDYNYYIDYKGNDTNDDWIGETNYTIPGPYGLNDTHPVTKVSIAGSPKHYGMISVAADDAVNGSIVQIPATSDYAGTRVFKSEVIGYYVDGIDVEGMSSITFDGTPDDMDKVIIDACSSYVNFQIDDTEEVAFYDLTIYNSDEDGMQIDYKTSVDIQNCNISGHSDDGIHLSYTNIESKMHISNMTRTSDQPMPAVDSNDNVHIVWAQSHKNGLDSIVYSMYDSAGKLLIDDTYITPMDDKKSMRPQIRIDSNDYVHIIWADKGSDESGEPKPQLHYTKLNPILDDRDGDSANESLITIVKDKPIMPHTQRCGADADFEIDSNNNLHIIYVEKEDGGLYYMKMNSNGVITYGPRQYHGSIEFLDINPSHPHPQLELDSSGDLHVIWADYYSTEEFELYYMMLNGQNGDVKINRTKLTADDGEKSMYPTMVIDSKNKLHVLWMDARLGGKAEWEIFYMKLDPIKDDRNGDRAKASKIKVIGDKQIGADDDHRTLAPVARIDGFDIIHLVYYEEGPVSYDVWYLQLDDNGVIVKESDWGSLGSYATSTVEGITFPYFDLDTKNQPHGTWCDSRATDNGFICKIAYFRPDGWLAEDRYFYIEDSIVSNNEDGIDFSLKMFDVNYEVHIENTWFFHNINDIQFYSRFLTSVDIDIDNCQFPVSETGIYIDGIRHGYAEISVTNSEFRDMDNGFLSDNIEYCRQLKMYFDNNYFESIDRSPIRIKTLACDAEIIVTNNEFRRSCYAGDDGAVNLEGVRGLYSETGPHQFDLDITITDNIFDTIWGRGFYLEEAASCNFGSFEISGNDFYDVYHPIFIAFLYGDFDIEINDNKITQFHEYGIHVGRLYRGILNWNVIGNDISSGTGESSGIYIEYIPNYATAYLNFSDNNIDGCGYGVYYDAARYGTLYIDMYNNTIDSCDYGYYFNKLYFSDMYMNFVDGVMKNIEDNPFYFYDLGPEDDPGYAEINIINTKVTGYGASGIYFQKIFDYGTRVKLEVRDCEFRHTSTYVPDYFIHVENKGSGSALIDIYDTTVVGYGEKGSGCGIYFNNDIDGNDDGVIVASIYESYFQDKVWPDIYAYKDIYVDEMSNVYVHIYNSNGLNTTSLTDNPTSVSWYWDCDVMVYTGLNLDKAAPNVDISVKDKLGGSSGGGTTDTNGQVNNIMLKSQTHFIDEDDDEFFTYYTPHTVSATNGIASVSKSVSVNTPNTPVTLYLTGDADADGFNDVIDSDDDNDGRTDAKDAFPNNPAEWDDTDSDGIGNNADTDDDGDGFDDGEDAFPLDPDEWSDFDNDGVGDNSDLDYDGDGWSDEIEISAGSDPKDSSSRPADMDGDGVADIYDPDIDGDNVTNEQDRFPYDKSETADSDGDGIGDNVDTDDDNDGYPDAVDEFPLDPYEWSDLDGDGIGDNRDKDIDGDGWGNDLEQSAGSNPLDAGSVPPDMDGDGVPDIYDTDIDGDGIHNDQDAFPRDSSEWRDSDNDGKGDSTDTDDDNDGYPDTEDKYPNNPDEWSDADGDGVGDNTDPDSDNDGYPDVKDDFPNDPDEWKDSDGDGQGDRSDPDRDGDGVDNDLDDFPNNPDESKDSDKDGLGDNSDPDDDGDGYPDISDEFPNDPEEWRDSDDDGTGDNADTDVDGDGVLNENDLFPNNPREYEDKDSDGVGDNIDSDDDNDGTPDVKDAFPNDPNEQLDSDGDGLGNEADPDDDNDGIPDSEDNQPLIPNIEKEEEEDKTEEVKDDLKAAQQQMNYMAIIGLILVVILIILLVARRPKPAAAAPPAPPPEKPERPQRRPPPPEKRGSGKPGRKEMEEEAEDWDEEDEDEDVEDWAIPEEED